MSRIDLCISQELFIQLQTGDEQAFEQVYYLYYDTLFKKVNNLCKEEELSHEIIQETFVQLFLNKQKIDDAQGIYAYLYTVSRRFAISAFRKSVVRASYQAHISNTFSEAHEDTYSGVVDKDLSRQLHDLIEELPEQQGKVFKMNKLEDMSYKEIAESIGVSTNTVRNQIASATKIIRFKMGKLLLFLVIPFLF